MSAAPAADVPWYHAGLKFRCTRCGNCCTGAPGYVWMDDDELAALAKHLGETPQRCRALYMREGHRGWTLRERSNGDCVFFDRSAGCTVYEVRPRQCRTWPFWESNLASPQDWARTQSACPGAGHGKLISAEEITRRLREIRL
jgi:Fe-S-cluster containining protein